jgi:putative inorganic carbon (hco3(-)) transporter
MGVEAQPLVQAKAPVPFKLAYKFVLLFMVIYFARPEDWIPGVQLLHPAKVVGILAILAFLAELGNARQKWPKECIYLFLLLGQMFLTVPFATAWRGGAFGATRDFANVVPMVLVVCLAVNTIPRLRSILFWQAASVAVIAPIAIVKFRHSGGRLEGVLNGSYSNSNDFALTMVIALPICLAFMLRSRNILVKAIWLLCMAAMTYSIVLTASRAGMLAFAVTMGIALWHFSVKGRYRYLLVLFGVLAVCALFFGGSELKTRYEAIFSPQESRSAYESAQQRNMLLRESIVYTFEHPIFGLGPGNFEIVSGDWHVTHNTYTQISSETGFPGFILYIMILVCAWKNLRRSKRMIKGQTELGLFTQAMQASLAGFCLGSFFASEGYQYFTYFLIAYTTVIYQVAKQRKQRVTTPISRPQEMPREEEMQGALAETAWSQF